MEMNFFKGRLPQNLLRLLLNALSHIYHTTPGFDSFSIFQKFSKNFNENKKEKI